jgi:hypothetical protein
MRIPLHAATSFALLTAIASSLPAQRRSAASFNGVWHQTEIRVQRPDSTYTRPPYVGTRIVYNGHFSQIFYAAPPQGVSGTRPTTAEEKAKRYDDVTTNAGHFEWTDSSFAVHFDYAKGPATIGTSSRSFYRLAGDSLWETTVARWSKDSTKLVRTTVKYVREP